MNAYVLTPAEEAEIAKNVEVLSHLDDTVADAVENILVRPEECWQPSDFLPDMSREDALEQVVELRQRAAGIPPEVITSLVGNMITEEALPSYSTFFNLLKGINDEGNQASQGPWVRWSRSWTAEENRHGDLLNKYLYLSGRADMRKVEVTIHNLIANGFDPKTGRDPYQAMIYTSFQERATKISHVNTGKLADKAGDSNLSRICKQIAGDEARHEKAYKSFMSRIFELDPDGALSAFEKMMKKQIAMPAIMMDGAENDNLFVKFSAITQKMNIYTAFDYASIIDHLVKLWKVEHLGGLKDGAAKMQDYLCTLSQRYLKIAERIKVPDIINPIWLAIR